MQWVHEPIKTQLMHEVSMKLQNQRKMSPFKQVKEANCSEDFQATFTSFTADFFNISIISMINKMVTFEIYV